MIPTAFFRFAKKQLSLRRQSGTLGIGWYGLTHLVVLVVKLVGTLVLTRLLAPEAYGIIGAALAVVTSLEWLCDRGIHRELSRGTRSNDLESLNTGWLIVVGRGSVLSIVALLSAYPLSRFYGEPTFAAVLVALAFRPFVTALRSPGLPLLKRNHNYRYLFFDEVVQTLVGAVCSIGIAAFFPSAWAIVIGAMVAALTSVILSYLLCPMMPRPKWDPSAANRFNKVGRYALLNAVAMAIFINLDRLLGLRWLDSAELGLYVVAFNLAAILENVVARICDNYSASLAGEGDPTSQRIWHELVIGRVARWGMPLAGIFLLISPQLFRLAYDPRYEQAGIIFAVLTGRLMIHAIGQLQYQYLLAVSDERPATSAHLIALMLQVLILIPLIRSFGPLGLAISTLLATTAATMVQTALLNRKAGNAWRPFWSTAGYAFAGMAFLVAV